MHSQQIRQSQLHGPAKGDDGFVVNDMINMVIEISIELITYEVFAE
jgi:hypothetical protein